MLSLLLAAVLKRPLPVGEFGSVNAVFVGVIGGLNNLIFQPFLDVRSSNVQPRDPVDYVDSQIKPVDLVFYSQLQRRIDVTVLFVSAHVQIFVVCAPVCELVNQPGIAVKVEDNGLVGGE